MWLCEFRLVMYTITSARPSDILTFVLSSVHALEIVLIDSSKSRQGLT